MVWLDFGIDLQNSIETPSLQPIRAPNASPIPSCALKRCAAAARRRSASSWRRRSRTRSACSSWRPALARLALAVLGG